MASRAILIYTPQTLTVWRRTPATPGQVTVAMKWLTKSCHHLRLMTLSATSYFTYIHSTLAWLVLYLLTFPSMAAEPSSSGPESAGKPLETNLPPTSPIRATGDGGFTPYLTSREFVLSLLVIIFAMITLGFEYAIMRHQSLASSDVFRMLAVTLIIVSTLFVITAGFSSEQLAPAMGLFGTIAGYLLGKSSHHNTDNKDTKDD